jgi:integrase
VTNRCLRVKIGSGGPVILATNQANELDVPSPVIKLELFRRHTPTCPDLGKGRNWLKCSGKRPCPLYCDGLVNGRRFRKSLGRDLGRAEKRLAQIEQTGHASGQEKTLAQMVKLYIEECRADKLAIGTVDRYQRILNALVAFAGKDPDLGQPFLATLSEFRLHQPWKAQNTMRQNLIALRTFGNWAVKHGWMTRNWAALIDLPDDPGGQTQPFSEEEVAALLAACDQLAGGFYCTADRARKRARAFLLVMLYTGLRVSDAVQLRRDHIDAEGRMFMKMLKTGEPIYLKLKPSVIQALNQLPEADNLRPGCFFWTTGSTLTSACSLYRRTLKFIQEHADVEDVRPHRFRDTFAKAVLDMGHPLSTLQLLLGHKNISTTERYYRHFSRQQQSLMDAAIDSLDFEQAPRTLLVHAGRNRRRNAEAHVVPFPATA